MAVISGRRARARAISQSVWMPIITSAFGPSAPLPEEVGHWSLTTLREKLVKIGARIVRHGRYVVFQLAEVAVPHSLFARILRRIDDLRPRPPPLAA